MHITPQIFEQLVKKSYNLDIIYLLKLINEEYDIEPLYENSMKISALRQTLIRKGLITEDNEKITLPGKDLLTFVDDKSVTKKSFIKRKPASSEFEEWWEAFPATDSFKVEGKIFKGTRSLRRGASQCRVKYNAILLEGKFTSKDLLDALKLEVNQKIENSLKKGVNTLTFMQNSVTYLNQRSFEAFVELIKQGFKLEGVEKTNNSTDI